MVKYIMAFILMAGLFIVGVGFSTPASAQLECDVCQEVIFNPRTDMRECACTEAASQYKSRGQCISTLMKDRCKTARPTGQERKQCEADVKDYCDCAVYHGCTDLPPGPPEDEGPS